MDDAAVIPLEPLEVIFEPDELPRVALPREVERVYGGTLGFREPCVVANFVTSADGVVAMPGVKGAVKMIRGASEADPFVMGLLRSCADALLIGATTFFASRERRWVAESIFPPAAGAYAELRRAVGRAEPPVLAVATASGRVDPAHPALEAGALVITTDRGARQLAGRLPGAVEVVSLGDRVSAAGAVAHLRERGHRVVLSEGGPTMFGSLLHDGVLDELFLTLSPVLAGRPERSERLGLVEGAAFLPERALAGRLLGVRREGSHLFLRYGVSAG